MPRPTDTTTSLSLSASALTDLYPQTLSGDEALNELGSLTLQGDSASALTLSSAVATHITATLHNDANQRPSMRWSRRSASSPPTPPPIVIKWCCAPGSGG